METIEVNGQTYYSDKPKENDGDLKICVLQRGHVLVGKLERKDSECKLHNASVIRYWGTTKGLGEIADGGPTSKTKLDKCNGLVEFDYLAVIFTLSCNEKKWSL